MALVVAVFILSLIAAFIGVRIVVALVRWFFDLD